MAVCRFVWQKVVCFAFFAILFTPALSQAAVCTVPGVGDLIPGPYQLSDVIQNGSFENGLTHWQTELTHKSQKNLLTLRSGLKTDNLSPSHGLTKLSIRNQKDQGQIYQNVSVEEGVPYLLIVDYSPRLESNSDHSGLRILANEIELEVIQSDIKRWQQKVYFVTPTTPTMRIAFEGVGKDAGHGAYIDNVRMIPFKLRFTGNIVQNSSFEVGTSIKKDKTELLESLGPWKAKDAPFILHNGLKTGGISPFNEYAKVELQSGVSIYQDIPTSTGDFYILTVRYAPNPSSLEESSIDLKFDGEFIDSLSSEQAAWEERTYIVQAMSNFSKLELAGVGDSQASGGYVDLIRLNRIQNCIVNLPPVADFDSSISDPERPFMVQHNSTSYDPDGFLVSQEWILPDGSTDLGGFVSRLYDLPAGTYPVTLKVTDNLGQTDQITKYIELGRPLPVIVVDIDQPVGVAPLTVNLDLSQSFSDNGAIAKYRWFDEDFNTLAETPEFQVLIEEPGVYYLTANVEDELGYNAFYTVSIEVLEPNQAPNVDFISHIFDPTRPFDVSHFADANDPDGFIVDYQWTLADGSLATGSTVSRSYDIEAGLYDVTLTVTDNEGATSSITKQIDLGRPLPIPVVNVSDVSGDAPLTVTFDASSSYSLNGDGSIAGFAWEVGDDQVYNPESFDAVFTRTFEEPGSYPVYLSIRDSQGYFGFYSVTINVTNPNNLAPIASMDIDIFDPERPFDVSHISNSYDPDGFIVSHEWTLADGTVVAGSFVPYTYDLPDGTYDVTLTVTDNEGAQSSITTQIELGRPVPVPVVSVDNLSGEAPLAVTFDASQSFSDNGSIVGYAWDITDDGIYNPVSTNAIFTTTFTEPGTYPVFLAIEDEAGYFGFYNVSIEVTEDPYLITPVVTVSPTRAVVPFTIIGDASASTGIIDEYKWKINGIEISSTSGTEVTIENSGTYTLELTLSNSTNQVTQTFSIEAEEQAPLNLNILYSDGETSGTRFMADGDTIKTNSITEGLTFDLSQTQSETSEILYYFIEDSNQETLVFSESPILRFFPKIVQTGVYRVGIDDRKGNRTFLSFTIDSSEILCDSSISGSTDCLLFENGARFVESDASTLNFNLNSQNTDLWLELEVGFVDKEGKLNALETQEYSVIGANITISDLNKLRSENQFRIYIAGLDQNGEVQVAYGPQLETLQSNVDVINNLGFEAAIVIRNEVFSRVFNLSEGPNIIDNIPSGLVSVDILGQEGGSTISYNIEASGSNTITLDNATIQSSSSLDVSSNTINVSSKAASSKVDHQKLTSQNTNTYHFNLGQYKSSFNSIDEEVVLQGATGIEYRYKTFTSQILDSLEENSALQAGLFNSVLLKDIEDNIGRDLNVKCSVLNDSWRAAIDSSYRDSFVSLKSLEAELNGLSLSFVQSQIFKQEEVPQQRQELEAVCYSSFPQLSPELSQCLDDALAFEQNHPINQTILLTLDLINQAILASGTYSSKSQTYQAFAFGPKNQYHITADFISNEKIIKSVSLGYLDERDLAFKTVVTQTGETIYAEKDLQLSLNKLNFAYDPSSTFIRLNSKMVSSSGAGLKKVAAPSSLSFRRTETISFVSCDVEGDYTDPDLLIGRLTHNIPLNFVGNENFPAGGVTAWLNAKHSLDEGNGNLLPIEIDDYGYLLGGEEIHINPFFPLSAQSAYPVDFAIPLTIDSNNTWNSFQFQNFRVFGTFYGDSIVAGRLLFELPSNFEQISNNQARLSLNFDASLIATSSLIPEIDLKNYEKVELKFILDYTKDGVVQTPIEVSQIFTINHNIRKRLGLDNTFQYSSKISMYGSQSLLRAVGDTVDHYISNPSTAGYNKPLYNDASLPFGGSFYIYTPGVLPPEYLPVGTSTINNSSTCSSSTIMINGWRACHLSHKKGDAIDGRYFGPEDISGTDRADYNRGASPGKIDDMAIFILTKYIYSHNKRSTICFDSNINDNIDPVDIPNDECSRDFESCVNNPATCSFDSSTVNSGLSVAFLSAVERLKNYTNSNRSYLDRIGSHLVSDDSKVYIEDGRFRRLQIVFNIQTIANSYNLSEVVDTSLPILSAISVIVERNWHLNLIRNGKIGKINLFRDTETLNSCSGCIKSENFPGHFDHFHAIFAQ